MRSDETTPNLLAAPKVGTTDDDQAVERLPQRLGRESTPLILPTSFRVKRMRRSRKRKLMMGVSLAVAAAMLLLLGTVFALRERLQQRFFPRSQPVMIEAAPKARPVPKAALVPKVP